jgi:hypothetical protein
MIKDVIIHDGRHPNGLVLNWGWECFGYRVDDKLFAYHRVQVGRFDEDEVYGSDGRYLGEIMSKNRLITHRGNKNYRHSGFAPVRHGSYARYANYAGYAMYAGFEDFPSPDEFK